MPMPAYGINCWLIWPSDLPLENATPVAEALQDKFSEVSTFLSRCFGRYIQTYDTEILQSHLTLATHLGRAWEASSVVEEVLIRHEIPILTRQNGDAPNWMHVSAIVGGGGFAGSWPPGVGRSGGTVLGDAFLSVIYPYRIDPRIPICEEIVPWPPICAMSPQTGALADEMSHLFDIAPFHRFNNGYTLYPDIRVNDEERNYALTVFSRFFTDREAPLLPEVAPPAVVPPPVAPPLVPLPPPDWIVTPSISPIWVLGGLVVGAIILSQRGK